jgi:hypothetical protein
VRRRRLSHGAIPQGLPAPGGRGYCGKRSSGMRKWLTRCALAAALILIVLLAIVRQYTSPMIRVGTPLPPGKVNPQLVIALETAALLTPDGSLWAWGVRAPT